MGTIKKNTNIDSAKMLTINTVSVLAVCALFAIINLATNNILPGILTFSLGVIIVIIATVLKKRASYSIRSMSISLLQFTAIFLITFIKGSTAEMFPLYLASIAFSGLYFNANLIKIEIIYANILLITVSIFFRDIAFNGEESSVIIVGIISINLASIFTWVVSKWGRDFINQSKVEEKEATTLIDTINKKMDESEEATKVQQTIFNKIKISAGKVNDTTYKMTDISNNLSAGADEQSSIIDSLTIEIKNIVEQIKLSSDISHNASEISSKALKQVAIGNSKMETMLVAMQDINDVSREISKIIKTIDDIAFQTNILALNAAVEAARAGQAGKGFSVVADEVRNLATKSATAAKTTEELIDKSILTVEIGLKIANETAIVLKEFMALTNDSERQSIIVSEKIEDQTALMNNVSDHIVLISDVVRKNADIASESSRISADLSEQSASLNKIVGTNK